MEPCLRLFAQEYRRSSIVPTFLAPVAETLRAGLAEAGRYPASTFVFAGG